jgi:release factor H-coupled RctB family protein
MTEATVKIIASADSWIDQVAIDQLHQTAKLEGIDEVIGLPDLHAGRGIAVGAAFWSRSHVYPHLVGSDIGCGMGLWQTSTALRKFKQDASAKKLSGLEAPWSGDHAERLSRAGLPPALLGDALGSIGGGNHFAELLCVDTILDEAAFVAHNLDSKAVYLMVHSGSRGLGHAILENQLGQQNVKSLIANSLPCSDYLLVHDQAVIWAKLNREIIAERFFNRLGMKGDRILDICHNSVTPWRDGWLHRKGAAPADCGLIVIPGSRGDLTYLAKPRADNADVSLQSLAHGAGRKWSRTEAKAKLKDRFSIANLERTKFGSRVICEDRELIYEEAPQAYKDIHQVIHDLVDAGLIDVVATLRPLITYKTRRT